MTTPRQRDRGLNRVSRLTRWCVVGATAATGLFGVLLARPATTSAKSTAETSTDGIAGTGSPATAGKSATGSGKSPSTTAPSKSGGSSSAGRQSQSAPSQLQTPSQAPQRSGRSSRATSGGS
jgi:hypothetical protein